MFSRKRTILFVDDEPRVLDALRRNLAANGGRWNMLFVGNAEAALAVLENQAVDVAVCDQRMPGMSGTQLLHEFHAREPETMRILLTGNRDQETAAAAINEGMVFRFLTKPCPVPVLEGAIDEALAARREAEEAARANAEALARNNAVLRQLVRDLTEANREMERLSFVAAHDLHEPLRQIKLYIQLLERRHPDLLTRDAAELFRFVVDGVRRMDDLAGGFSAYVQAAVSGSSFTEVDTSDACKAAADQLAAGIDAAKARVRVGPLPVVTGDRRAIIELFRQLIHNSLRFRRPTAAPDVAVEAAGDGQTWTFSVTDNGIGIEETAQDVFDIFRQLHGPGTYGGVGIGLAICRRIVRGHGGRIWFEPNPPGGTVVRFTLPAGPAAHCMTERPPPDGTPP